MERSDLADKGVLTFYDLFGRGKVWRAIDLLAGVAFCTLAVVFWQNWLFRYGFLVVGAAKKAAGAAGEAAKQAGKSAGTRSRASGGRKK